MSKFNTSSEYYAALTVKFSKGGYGHLKHPEMVQWFVNEETANGIIADTKALVSCLSDDKLEAARGAFRSFRTMIRDVIRYAEYPTIHDLPSVYTIMAIDDSYDTIERIITGPMGGEKENTIMADTIKEQMQAGIDECSNTISFDEFNTKAEAAERKINVEITDGEEKVISSPRQNNIADLCNIVNIASTIALTIKSYRNKKTNGKYRISDLACVMLSGYITGSSIRETYQDFPNSKSGKLYRNIARFMKKVVETTKKMVIKTIRKEEVKDEER